MYWHVSSEFDGIIDSFSVIPIFQMDLMEKQQQNPNQMKEPHLCV